MNEIVVVGVCTVTAIVGVLLIRFMVRKIMADLNGLINYIRYDLWE